MRIAVRVVPRASRNELAGRQGERWRIRLTAPPVEGKANEALRGFLAERLGVRRSDVHIVAGETGRDKLVEVTGVVRDDVERRLSAD